MNIPTAESIVQTATITSLAHTAAAETSCISTFTDPAQAQDASAISSFTNPAHTITTPKLSSNSHPRPRPRPIIKGPKPAIDTSLSTSDTSLLIQTPSTDAAPVPTIIDHSASLQPTLPNGVEPPLDFSLDIAERAKMRRRNTTKPAPYSGYSAEVIELSSDDEIALVPSHAAKPKPRPKPRPIKRAKASHPPDPDASFPELEGTSFRLPSPSSHLSPSEPPPPSTGPRVSMSPQKGPDDVGPADVSPVLNLSHKRKRQDVQSGASEQRDDSELFEQNAAQMPPAPRPPLLFADSSASGTRSTVYEPPPPPETKRNPSKKDVGKEGDVVKGKPTSSRSRKKKATMVVVIKSPVRRKGKGKDKQNIFGDGEKEEPGTGVESKAAAASTSRHNEAAGAALTEYSDLTPPPGSDEGELQLLPKTVGRKGQQRKPSKTGKGKENVIERHDAGTSGKKSSSKRRAVILSDAEEEFAAPALKESAKKGVKGRTGRKKNKATEDDPAMEDDPNMGNSLAMEVDEDEGISKTNDRSAEAEIPQQSKVTSLFEPLCDSYLCFSRKTCLLMHQLVPRPIPAHPHLPKPRPSLQVRSRGAIRSAVLRSRRPCRSSSDAQHRTRILPSRHHLSTHRSSGRPSPLSAASLRCTLIAALPRLYHLVRPHLRRARR
jgi:hypothetical protein